MFMVRWYVFADFIINVMMLVFLKLVGLVVCSKSVFLLGLLFPALYVHLQSAFYRLQD